MNRHKARTSASNFFITDFCAFAAPLWGAWPTYDNWNYKFFKYQTQLSGCWLMVSEYFIISGWGFRICWGWNSQKYGKCSTLTLCYHIIWLGRKQDLWNCLPQILLSDTSNLFLKGLLVLQLDYEKHDQYMIIEITNSSNSQWEIIPIILKVLFENLRFLEYWISIWRLVTKIFFNSARPYQSPLPAMWKFKPLMGVRGSMLSTGQQFGFDCWRVQSWASGGVMQSWSKRF